MANKTTEQTTARPNFDNVDHMLDVVTEANKDWCTVYDCVMGQRAVKDAKEKYLPKPVRSDDPKQDEDRYGPYVQRAVFHNVTGRTLRGLVGQVFSEEPEVQVPRSLQPTVDNITGSGISLQQQARKALSFNLSFGRGGLLADFPTTEGDTPVTKQQLNEGEVRPTISLYSPQSIINWDTKEVGATTILCLVVLKERVSRRKAGDLFEEETITQYRVLRLNEEGQYEQWIVEHDDKNKVTGPLSVQDGTGEPMTRIPFTFIGSENNDSTIDPAPILDIANLNIAHYRNSADFEESVFVSGQPTVWVSGLTEQWNENVLKGKVNLGALGGLPLPRDAQAGLLQAQPNTLVSAAMEHKERQMVALGAKLVEESSRTMTATEARQNEAAETSVLKSAANNVSAAYQQALEWAGGFIKETGTIVFKLNNDFEVSRMSPEDRKQTIAEWQSEAISFTELRNRFRKGGVATLEDEDALDEIAANPPITVPTDTPPGNNPKEEEETEE